MPDSLEKNIKVPAIEQEPRLDMRYIRPDAVEKNLGKRRFLLMMFI